MRRLRDALDALLPPHWRGLSALAWADEIVNHFAARWLHLPRWQWLCDQHDKTITDEAA